MASSIQGIANRASAGFFFRDAATDFCLRKISSKFTSQLLKKRGFKLAIPVRCQSETNLPEADPTTIKPPSALVETKEGIELCCPVCQNPLIDGPSSKKSSLLCQRCQIKFSTKGNVADLTLASESSPYEESQLPGTFIFQNPLVAYVYERGWRQGFSYAGFPGVEEEFKLAEKYFKPIRGEPLLDVSCGSGLFSRRFLKSAHYSTVVASDFSSSMLSQCQEFLSDDNSLDFSKIALVRADVARLPFKTSSFGGVHAGAAIHCWPQPAAAFAEISRVLKPGGVFVGTTFIIPRDQILGELFKPIASLALQGPLDPYRWWSDKELKDLTASFGLIDYESLIKQNFIIFTARKPTLI